MGRENSVSRIAGCFRINANRFHKVHSFRNTLGDFLIAFTLWAVIDKIEHPFMHIFKLGKAAMGKRTQKVQGCGRLAICIDLAHRV